MREREIWWGILLVGLCLFLGSVFAKKPVPVRFFIFEDKARAFLWLLLGYLAVLLALVNLFRRVLLPIVLLTLAFLLLLLFI